MFTGLVEETGRATRFEKTPGGVWILEITAERILPGLQIGDSVATNGCCLTVTRVSGSWIAFDLLDETLRRTTLGAIKPGDAVNLERSVTPTTRLGGHFVTGHVDGVGVIEIFEPRGANHLLRVRPPYEFLKYIVEKGCVAVDGLSLTVAGLGDGAFDLWIIPHTLTVTALSSRRAGDPVNLEFDILAKYVERLSLFPGTTIPTPHA